MALYDYKLGFPESLRRSYDYTIIGFGAVGIYVSRKLVERGKSVLIIETGDFKERVEYQILNRAKLSSERLKTTVEWGRKRALGGTTIAWGGQALPFSKSDFERTFNGSQAFWPYKIEDLQDSYKRAEEFLNVGRLDYFQNGLKALGLDGIIDSRDFSLHLSKWAPRPNLFKVHGRFIGNTVDVLYNATCCDITFDQKQCRAIKIKSLNGNSDDIFVKNLILANGTFESIRMLLQQNEYLQLPELGVGIMEHPIWNLGKVKTTNLLDLHKIFGVRFFRGKKYSVRLSLSDEMIHASRTQNMSFSIMFQTPDEGFDIYRDAKGAKGLDILKSRKGLISVFRSFYYLLTHGIIYRPFAEPHLAVMMEQRRVPTNFVELDKNAVDEFGCPKLVFHWGQDPDIVQNLRVAARKCSKVLCALDFVESIDLNLPQDMDDFERGFSYAMHHMGGAAIGAVVDKSLRVRGLNNLYLCSPAILVSSGHSNPTLTTLALVDKAFE